MSDDAIIYLTERVAAMSHEDDPGKVRVRLAREPAVMWVDPAAMNVLDRLADAVESGDEVSIAVRAETGQIVSVVEA